MPRALSGRAAEISTSCWAQAAYGSLAHRRGLSWGWAGTCLGIEQRQARDNFNQATTKRSSCTVCYLVVVPRFNGQVVKPPAYTTIDTMNRQRRRFTTEQKAEAVGLCLRENLSILEASKRLGVHASCLGRWVKQAQIDQGGLKDSGPLTSDERIEFTRLRKENRELRREKDFFRLAAAHFAKEQLSQRGFQ
jgi:transposase